MNNLSKADLNEILASSDAVISAIAGENEDVHPGNTDKMIGLWDDLNDRHAPPEIVKALVSELLARREAAEKPVAWMVGDVTLYNPDTVEAYIKRSGLPVIPLFAGTPLPVVPQALLRELVDVVWQDSKESTEVPATSHADELIGRVFTSDQAMPDERAAFNAWSNDESLPIAGVGAKNAAWLAWQARAAMLNHIPGDGNMVNHPVIPDGWALVPIEPTPAMMVAGTLVSEYQEDPAGMYRTMVAAAPKPDSDNITESTAQQFESLPKRSAHE